MGSLLSGLCLLHLLDRWHCPAFSGLLAPGTHGVRGAAELPLNHRIIAHGEDLGFALPAPPQEPQLALPAQAPTKIFEAPPLRLSHFKAAVEPQENQTLASSINLRVFLEVSLFFGVGEQHYHYYLRSRHHGFLLGRRFMCSLDRR